MVLFRALLIASVAAVAGCAAADPPPPPHVQATRDADLVQSVLRCMADFGASSEQHPETVKLADGSRVRAWRTGRYGTPKVRAPSSGQHETCSFVFVEWSRSRWLAFPACKRPMGWNVFGSGYGRITWARPTIACARSAPVS